MPQCIAMLLKASQQVLLDEAAVHCRSFALGLPVCRLPQQHHFMKEPVLGGDVCHGSSHQGFPKQQLSHRDLVHRKDSGTM